MEQDTMTLLNDQLVAEIRRYVQDEIILDAFRKVPRHAFVPSFFDRIEANKREWRKLSASNNQDEWVEHVYKNRPLTISIDRYGKPDSSSSQPNLMAQMIQSVKIRHGHRVLEIGTGSGYNAALLGCIVGPENVVTIDVNEALLDEARARITSILGSGMTILHADGRSLSECLGLFDAIIVTGAHERLEPSWMHALAPGGRLVFNWTKSFTPVMIEAEKSQGTMVGRVCAYDGEFMFLHNGSGVEETRLLHEPLGLVACLDFRSRLFEDPDFGFFLQITMPPLHFHRYRNASGERSYAVKELRTHRVVRFLPVKIRGDKTLWEEIHAVSEKFEQLLQPSRKAFSLMVDEKGVMTFIYKKYVFLVP